ncbi:MAG TPA: hypothetical protein DCF68_15850 [Cyanothece sp. UBA12306]|nr:hypothetical protein [Cyanothece sp. UBA12306]
MMINGVYGNLKQQEQFRCSIQLIKPPPDTLDDNESNQIILENEMVISINNQALAQQIQQGNYHIYYFQRGEIESPRTLWHFNFNPTLLNLQNSTFSGKIYLGDPDNPSQGRGEYFRFKVIISQDRKDYIEQYHEIVYSDDRTDWLRRPKPKLPEPIHQSCEKDIRVYRQS